MATSSTSRRAIFRDENGQIITGSFRKVLPPLGQCKPFQEVLIELGSRLKLPTFVTKDGQRKYRNESGMFVVEGIHHVGEAFVAGAQVISFPIDKGIVDRFFDGIAHGVGAAAKSLRRVQTGLIQNYALVMLFGVFAFLTLYFFTR